MARFHIHIGASSLPKSLERTLRDEIGFVRTDFASGSDEVGPYDPPYHLTNKIDSGREFRKIFAHARTVVETTRTVLAYVEGEFVACDDDLPEASFDPTIVVPFRVELRHLRTNTFRESEIHVSMSAYRSDKRLRRRLHEMGLFPSYVPKASGTFQVFSVQGGRDEIHTLEPALRNYLLEAGGIIEGSIKVEHVARWWVSNPAPALPPVVRRIHWP